MQGFAQHFQMILKPAHAQVMCNGRLRDGGATDIVHAFHLVHAVKEFAGDGPADAIAGGEGFGKRRAMHHQPFFVIILAGLGAVAAEVKFTVNIIFYQRDVFRRHHFHELLFIFVGHAAAERVIKIRDHHAGFDREFFHGFLQAVEADTGNGVCGNFHRLQS